MKDMTLNATTYGPDGEIIKKHATRKMLDPDEEQRRRYLAEAKDQYQLPQSSYRFNVRKFIDDPEAMEALCDHVASGNSVRQFCELIKIDPSKGARITQAMVKLEEDDPRKELWLNAKRARACQFAERMLNMVEQVEVGLMTPQQGSMCVKTLQWLAERLDPEEWSGRLKIDATLAVDTASQHLEAVRTLAGMVRDGSRGRVIESVKGNQVVAEVPKGEEAKPNEVRPGHFNQLLE